MEDGAHADNHQGSAFAFLRSAPGSVIGFGFNCLAEPKMIPASLKPDQDDTMQRLGLLLALLVLLFPIEKAEARKQEPVDTYEYATNWVPLSKSMTELLNEGWVISGFNDYQTEMFSNNFTSYTFVLKSGNRYVLCFLNSPAMNDAKSKCRALN